jgi:hypothetical protein
MFLTLSNLIKKRQGGAKMSKFKEITKEEQKERTNVQPRDSTLHGESMAQLNRNQILDIVHVLFTQSVPRCLVPSYRTP